MTDYTKQTRPLPVPVPIRNPLSLTLLWASKTDPRLLAVCSRWAMATQTSFGVFVFFTAALALGGSYYTLSTLNTPNLQALGIALGWSTFVFFLDREIVGGLDKTSALVRPLLALFLGTIVAIPIELRVFEKRIDQDLQRQYRQDNQEQFDSLRGAQTQLEQRRSELHAQLAELRRQDADWARVMDDELVGRPKSGRTGIGGAGPVFENAKSQQAGVRQRVQEARSELEEFERSMPEERGRLDTQFQREEIGKATDFVTRYEAMDRVVHSSDALYWLSWIVTLTLILIEMTPALLKLFTPHSDYNHLVKAEIRENITRIDEIGDRNYRLAMDHPELPELSVAEKFAKVRYTPVSPEPALPVAMGQDHCFC